VKAVSIPDDPQAWLEKACVRFGDVLVPPLEAFQALRAVGQLFLRNLSANKISSSGTRWSDILAKLSLQASSTRAIELLSVSDRSILVPLAHRILSDWPVSLISFCRETGITRAHFNGAYHMQPSWMTAVTDAHLAKQNRFVTPESLASAVADLQRKQGRIPTITEVRSHLKWSGEKGLADFFPPKRSTATQDEWLSFLQSCNELLEQITLMSLRSRLAALNDLVAILVDLLAANGMPLGECSSRKVMVNALATGRVSCILDGTELADLTDSILLAIRKDMGLSNRVFADEHPSIRQTNKRLRALSVSLPIDLERKVTVFLVAARNCGLTHVHQH
jgi:hypothetical protein